MLAAFTLALSQLGDRRILAVLVKSLALTVVVFAVMGAGLWFAITQTMGQDGNAGVLGAIVAGTLLIVSLWLLFRLVALAVLQLFGDEVVRAVEARHYPSAAASARALGWREELRVGLRSLGRSLGYNLLALPVALTLLVTGVGTVVVFAAVNAVLLGRELTEIVALRHRDDVGKVPLPGFATRTALGAIVVALLLVPFVNLLAPVLGAAAATHLVHRKRAA
jgi:CysZ protein